MKVARPCGGCVQCCESMSVDSIGKPADTPCPDQCADGCGIYATRPVACAGFACGWALGIGAERERPDRVGAFHVIDPVAGTVSLHFVKDWKDRPARRAFMRRWGKPGRPPAARLVRALRRIAASSTRD